MPKAYGWALEVREPFKKSLNMLCTYVPVCLGWDPQLHQMLKEIKDFGIVRNL